MCALGVCDVVGALDINRPVMLYGGCERKHASEAPAGPAPTIRNGVSMMWRRDRPSPLTKAVEPILIENLLDLLEELYGG